MKILFIDEFEKKAVLENQNHLSIIESVQSVFK